MTNLLRRFKCWLGRHGKTEVCAKFGNIAKEGHLPLMATYYYLGCKHCGKVKP